MNFSNLSSQVSFTLGNIIILAVVLVLLLCVLVYIVVKLNRRLNESKATKYGFGGKSIYSALGVLFLAAAIPLTVTLISNSTDIRRQASLISDIIINVNKIQSADGSLYSFTAIPIYEDKPVETSYDLNWTIEGAGQTITKTESARSSEHPSYFEQQLDKGSYKITVQAITQDGTKIIKEKEFLVE